MSSTDLDAPPLKSLLLAIVAVLGLHVLAAIALVAIKTPELKPEPKKEMLPLEIKFVSLPAKMVSTEVEKQTVTAKKEVQPEVQVQPAPQPEPKPEEPVKQPTETPVKPKEPVVKNVEPKVTPVIASEKPRPDTSQKVAPKEPLPKPKVDNSAAEAQRQAAAQAESERQAKKSEQEAQARAEQEAKRVADAKAAVQAKAAAEAAAAQARAEAEAAAALAQSNEPVSFTASSANWASAPNFSFPERAARRARSGDTLNVVLVLRVNKQGGIDNVRVAQSSGNPLLDKEARRQVRSGKFKPFTKNGVPVVGDVTLPISYAVP
ncbi:energy transducer TonB [Psychrobacter sp. MES7-P7E]|uniref:energy transducer TonB n=1 Tax=Psychrobacter sp. MES7-P7E TaxID=2058322 RepID=UPI000C7EF86A|nr:energy transducer TonB [Psychrobacter sp. MES7-P7E]PLT22572.1 energy transducer TonB [Psychrobacter sp. MES7-P7E]